jgi:hypothetical protein
VLALAYDLHAASLGPPSGAPRISGVSMTRVVGIDHLESIHDQTEFWQSFRTISLIEAPTQEGEGVSV